MCTESQSLAIPALHVHLYEPAVLMHSALSSQSLVESFRHSSISTNFSEGIINSKPNNAMY